MKYMSVAGAAFLSLLIGTASAQTKTEKADAKKAAPAAVTGAAAAPVPPPPPPAPPGPSAEVTAMIKDQKGTWTCKGSMFNPGGASPMTAKIVNKAALDGSWLQTTFTDSAKKGYKFESFTTWDASTKQWHRIMLDNMGGQEVATSDGPKDGKLVWNATARSPMGASMGRHHEEMVGKEMKSWGEYSMDKGKTWMKAYENVCKR